jgi:hypothetical protein
LSTPRVAFVSPYHKNGNCFAEQKNGDAACKTLGHGRFEGQVMRDDMEAVCPDV